MEVLAMSTLLIRLTCAAALAGSFALPLPAMAEVVNYGAQLAGSTEVPPNDSAGTGTVEATYDTDSKSFSWTINYSGLTGDAAAAHFHGPAGPSENAPPVVPLEGSLASPISGSATLSDAQAADLEAGRWYFNLHTAQHPDGEIRGQVTKQ
jgi:hypothetical protein